MRIGVTSRLGALLPPPCGALPAPGGLSRSIMYCLSTRPFSAQLPSHAATMLSTVDWQLFCAALFSPAPFLQLSPTTFSMRAH